MSRRLILNTLFAIFGISVLVAASPSWWSEGTPPAVDATQDEANYAPANLGQLKHMAMRAKEHLDGNLAGGAGSEIETLIGGFAPPPGGFTSEEIAANYAPLNLGQLKAVAKPFYDRLHAAGYDTKASLIFRGHPDNWTGTGAWAGYYPWNPATPVEQNYAPANLGQLKLVFSFDLEGFDSDRDGLPDAWEIERFGDLSATASGDPDGDGFTNLQEFGASSDPQDYYSQGEDQISPVISISQGNTQTGEPSTLAPLSMRVFVTEGTDPLNNAPVTFSVLSGDGQVSTSSGGIGLASSLTVRTNSFGYAEVFFKFPSAYSSASIIKAEAGSPPSEVSVDFSALSSSIPLSGLSLWLKADAGVTTDGSNGVSSWEDQSGGGRNLVQSTSANRPTLQNSILNGKPVVRFDGSNDNLGVSTSSGWGTTQYTVAFLIKPNTTTNYNQQIRAAGGWGQFYFHTTNAGSVYVGVGPADASRLTPGSGAGQVPNGTIVPAAWQFLTFTYHSGVGKLYKNGLLIATKTFAVAPTIWTGFILGATTTDTINGDIAEVMVYSTALEQSQVSDLKQYLVEKYDLDTDGDGMSDSYEIANGLNPLVDDRFSDKDGDGIPNIWEYVNGSAAGTQGSMSPDWIVDPAHAADSATDNIVTTIGEAVTGVPVDNANVAASYKTILVKAGIYAESVTIPGNKRIALVAERGGNVFLQGSSTSATCLTFSNLSFIDGFVINRSEALIQSGTVTGIGVQNNGSTAPGVGRISNCIIYGHSIGVSFGSNPTGTSDMQYCTVLRNRTAEMSAPYRDRIATIKNCIIWNPQTGAVNQFASGNGYAANLTGNIVYGGVWGGTNADPKLSSEGRLGYASAAIDSATTTPSLNIDIENEARPFGAGRDMGADEWVDNDADNLSDQWEMRWFGDLDEIASTDADGDGLDNAAEFTNGTDPFMADTDADGATDGAEVTAGSSPRSADSDNDGMSDGYEIANGLNPLADDRFSDKDGDGIPNIWEYVNGSAAGTKSSIAPDWIVDPAHAADSPTDNIVATIGGAVTGVPVDNANVAASYKTILVKAGTYAESVTIPGNKRIALIAERGGNVFLQGSSASATCLTFSNLSFIDGFVINRSEALIQSGTVTGIGVQNNGSTAPGVGRISNCIIYGHSIGVSFGSNPTGTSDMQYCTVLRNRTAEMSAPYRDRIATIKNCIIWNPQTGSVNQFASGNGYAANLTGNIVYGGVWSGMNADPLITNDGRIRYGSPAIDAAVSPIALESDIDGEVRPNGSGRDIGADEWVDSDGDQLSDYWEMKWFGDLDELAGGDSDGDGLQNLDEFNMSSSPASQDSDSDGITDGDEVHLYGSAPGNPDTDFDSMPDDYEIENGLQVAVADDLLDLDGDRIPNGWEWAKGTAANDAEDFPPFTYVVDQVHGNDSPSDIIYPSITAALNAAPAVVGTGDVGYSIISVKPGFYQESIVLTSNKAVALLAEGGGRRTEIQPTNNSSVAITVSGRSVVDGFFISRPVETVASGATTNAGLSFDNQQAYCRIINTIVTGNKSANGAVYGTAGRAIFEACTIFDNKSVGSTVVGVNAGGISLFTLKDCILWNLSFEAPEILQASGASITATNTISRGGQYSTIDINPQLRSDGSLMPESPAIDAGSVSLNTVVDVDGEQRSFGVASDIGADEFVDTDADQLPDRWEMYWFGDLDQDGDDDPEEDRLLNRYEYIFEKNPIGTGVPTSGLLLWLKADAGITKDGSDKVSGWADQSGVGNNAFQATGAKQPLFVSSSINGKPAVQFGGTQYLSITDNLGLRVTRLTVFAVVKRNTTTAHQVLMSRSYRASTWTSPYLTYYFSVLGSNSSIGQRGCVTVGSGSMREVNVSITNVTSPEILGWTFDQDYLNSYKGRILSGSLGVNGTIDYSQGATGVTIGAANSVVGNDYLRADVAELIFFDRSLDPAEVHQVSEYLAQKYTLDDDGDGEPSDSLDNDLWEALSETSNPGYPAEWKVDTDGDGLTDGWEYYYESDPEALDTNHDGIGDYAAFLLGFSLTEEDVDGDGISNLNELAAGTEMWNADTDGDGHDDGEDAFALDPTRHDPLSSDPGDTTAPTITVTEPTSAVLIP